MAKSRASPRPATPRDAARSSPRPAETGAQDGGASGAHLLLWTDARMYRDWLARSLETHDAIAEARTAADAQEAGRCLRQHRVDVVVIDATVPNLPDAIGMVHQNAPDTHIVVFGVSDVDSEVLGIAELGIGGYVTRQATVGALVEAIQGAQRGELLCPPRIAGRLLDRVAELASERRAEADELPLTPREFEIAELIEHGLSNKEIARRTSIEVATVKNHVHNILEKLNVRRRGEAAARLRRRRQRPGGRTPAAPGA